MHMPLELINTTKLDQLLDTQKQNSLQHAKLSNCGVEQVYKDPTDIKIQEDNPLYQTPRKRPVAMPETPLWVCIMENISLL